MIIDGRGVAQLGRALGSGLRGPRFKSAHPDCKDGPSASHDAGGSSSLRRGALLKTTFEEGSYGKEAFYHVRLDGSQVTVCYNRDHPFNQVLHDYQSDPRTIAVPDQIEPGGGTFSGGESH
jgi:hypothetical protein